MGTHTATPSPTSTAHRAVILGGSIAGLLAARVLADHADEVLILDRDELPPLPKHRRGVPQDRHAHALLATGRQLLEQLLPGLTGELVARGAPTGDLLGDARVHLSGHRLARTDSGLFGVMASRTLLEDQMRRRVRALDNVVVAPPSDALGLVVDDSGERIAGVRLLERSDNSAEQVVDAGLVIDAPGRGTGSRRSGSRLPKRIGSRWTLAMPPVASVPVRATSRGTWPRSKVRIQPSLAVASSPAWREIDG